MVIFRIKVCFWIGRRHINIENAEQCGISFLEASRTMEKQKEIKKGKASQTPLKKQVC